MPNRQIVNGEPYRYAFQGQEKDPETGKEAFQLRLYDARIGRWLTPDPKSEFHSPYLGLGNIPTSAFDGDGGFVYIMGANGNLLRVYNKVAQTEIGANAISYFINNPRKHVIISAASKAGAGAVTNKIPRTLTDDLPYTYNTASWMLEGANRSKGYQAGNLRYANHTDSFIGATIQPGDTYLISIGMSKNPHLHYENAFHELYAHALLEEAGITNGNDQHFELGATENGVLSEIGKPPYRMPSNPVPIQIFDMQLKQLEFSSIFDLNKLFFGNEFSGSARKVESNIIFGEGNFEFPD